MTPLRWLHCIILYQQLSFSIKRVLLNFRIERMLIFLMDTIFTALSVPIHHKIIEWQAQKHFHVIRNYEFMSKHIKTKNLPVISS